MTLPNVPVGRVAETRFRDFARDLMRRTEPEPARPTKTIIAPGDEPAGLRAAEATETMPLTGGWSLTSDHLGSLWLTHTDGSRQLLAVRTTPAPSEPTANEPTEGEGDDQHG